MFVVLTGNHPYGPIIEHATLRYEHRVDTLYQLFAAYGNLPGGKIVLAVKNDFLFLGESLPIDRHLGSKDKLGLVLKHHIVSFGIVVPIPLQLHLARLHQLGRSERIHLTVHLLLIDRSCLKKISTPLGRKFTPNLIRHFLFRIMNRFLVQESRRIFFKREFFSLVSALYAFLNDKSAGTTVEHGSVFFTSNSPLQQGGAILVLSGRQGLHMVIFGHNEIRGLGNLIITFLKSLKTINSCHLAFLFD